MAKVPNDNDGDNKNKAKKAANIGGEKQNLINLVLRVVPHAKECIHQLNQATSSQLVTLLMETEIARLTGEKEIQKEAKNPKTKGQSVSFTNEDIIQLGYNYFTNYTTCFVALEEMTFNSYRILYIDNSDFINNCWYYSSFVECLVAFIVWDPFVELEPTGWFRNPKTGRRRPDGDPRFEYIHH